MDFGNGNPIASNGRTDGYVLSLINSDENNHAVFFDNYGKVLWKQIFNDKYFVNCEINNDWKAFLIQNSEFIYCYKRIDEKWLTE